MEITINYYGQAVSVSVEVYEYLFRNLGWSAPLRGSGFF